MCMLLSIEVSSSCCAAAWLSHAGSPCPSSSLICALLPLDQATDLFFFLTFLPAKGWSVCPLQIKQFFSLLFHISSIAALLKPIVVVSSPCPVGMFQWCPWTSWPSYPWGWPLVPDKNKAFPPIGYSLGEHQLLFSPAFAWRSLELEKILRRQPEPRPKMGVHVGTRYKTSVLVLPVWRGQSENMLVQKSGEGSPWWVWRPGRRGAPPAAAIL